MTLSAYIEVKTIYSIVIIFLSYS